MGDFDKIIKENIEAIFLPVIEKLLNLSIKESFEIKDGIQRTIERKPDYLNKVIDGQGHEFILHIEFQTTNDHEMVYRMAEYKALLQRKHKIPVKQFVIFLGAGKVTMQTHLAEEEQITGFTLKNIHDFPTKQALESEIPEEIILSILTDYPEKDAHKIIEQVIAKLQQATHDETKLRQSIEQLLILGRLRNLDEKIEKQVKEMPITYDITTDRLYKKGIERGIEKGIERGIEKGIERGIEQKKHEVVLKALNNKKLTIEEIAELANVAIDYVLAVQAELNDQ